MMIDKEELSEPELFGCGHFVKQCRSSHWCQRPHPTVVQIEVQSDASAHSSPTTQIVSNAVVKLKSSLLLMTCCVLVFTPDGSSVQVRALLDNGSTSSFVSEHFVPSGWK